MLRSIQLGSLIILSLQKSVCRASTLLGRHNTACFAPPPLFARRNTKSSSVFFSAVVDNHAFPDELIESLDLVPLLQGVADHAGTKRGRQALLSLVKGDAQQQSSMLLPEMSSRRRRVTNHRLFMGTSQNAAVSSKRHSELVTVAQSAEAARREYELVEEAMLTLDRYEGLQYPPLYGSDSSPMDFQNQPDTDDDDWLWLSGGAADDDDQRLTLEHVLQAEQVMKTLMKIQDWARHPSVQTWTPGLVAIAQRIAWDTLGPALETIHNAVEIVRVRSLAADPNGRSVRYCFDTNKMFL